MRSAPRAGRALVAPALVAKNRAGEPTYLAAEINHGSAVRLTPNAINYGWVDPATGRPLLTATASICAVSTIVDDRAGAALTACAPRKALMRVREANVQGVIPTLIRW